MKMRLRGVGRVPRAAVSRALLRRAISEVAKITSDELHWNSRACCYHDMNEGVTTADTASTAVGLMCQVNKGVRLPEGPEITLLGNSAL